MPPTPAHSKLSSVRVSARAIALALAGAVVSLAIGCSDGTAPLPVVATVAVSPSSVSLVPGGTQMLVAAAKGATGETLTGRATTWTSSDESKVTVAGGLVTGVAIGSATITASVEGVQASIDVQVRDGAVVGAGGLTFTDFTGKLTVAVPPNALAQLTILTVGPAASAPSSVRLLGGTAFIIGPPTVAFAQPVAIGISYDPSLLPAGYSESEVQLYEAAAGGWRLVEGSLANIGTKTVTGSVSGAGVFAVLARPRVETVTVTGLTGSIAVLATQQLVATLRDVEGTQLTRPVSWESSDPSIASVTGAGLVTAKAPGAATVTATSEGKSGSLAVTVTIGPAAKLLPFAGNNQTARPGLAVAIPPSMLVTDAAGFPVPGASVTFAVTAGGGTVTGGAATTNASGIAAAGSWTLGPAVGPNSLTASAAGLEGSPFVFNATAAIPAPAAMVAVAGNNQSGQPGDVLPVAPSVKVTDVEGEPAAGVAVQFAVGVGGGSITGASVTTGSDGLATAGTWTLGLSGPNTVVATSPDLPGASVTFTAAAGPPPPVKIEPSDGFGQSGTVDTFVANPPSVFVTDANGVPVAGVAVTWSVGVGGGSVVGPESVTDALGIARVGGWRLGPVPGQNTLLATAAGLTGSPVVFGATGVAAAASAMALNAGNNQSAAAGEAVAVPPSVKITDPSGNPVGGVNVTFAVSSGGGSVSGGSAVSNAAGIATVGSWTLGAGANSLTASVPGLSGSPVIFVATGVAPAAPTMTLNAGNNQSTAAGNAVAVPPSVRITDSSGNPVAGVTVTFTVTSGGGVVSGGSPVSDASGIATVGSWVLGLGVNSLSASAPGLSGSPVVFNATGAVEVQIVTFGDSNTDLGYVGTNPLIVAASYVSVASQRLDPGAPHSPHQLAGKIEAAWKANSTRSIRVVNHGISGTSTGAGRSALGAPHALEQVGGVSRFRGEVMGDAYPWSGGEPYLSGAGARTQAFVPRTSDFAYVSMGTNDIVGEVAPETIAANLRAMISEWVGRGLPAARFILTTIPPGPGENPNIPQVNGLIKALASETHVSLIDLANFVSDNNDGLKWKSADMYVEGQELHYSEMVRNWLAARIVEIMLPL